ncbi:hypothetical protein [Streptomyces pinistramenti]|uniref:hypothetical protein n=1 Tax=Streptomyces pinistramenti TaxID=2884812 RepID=UPI001D07E35B|nr:hypothetical protein [Streptomyces pinistramenti]MCB5910412.1 hypothetical protein [Streptomyces pinistramenti]
MSGLLAVAVRGGELIDDLQSAAVLAGSAAGCPAAVRGGSTSVGDEAMHTALPIVRRMLREAPRTTRGGTAS